MSMSVVVDKDALDFLKAMCVGAYDDPYEAASNRAYRDLNRTIRYQTMSSDVRETLRKKTTELLRREITWMMSNVTTQDAFDSWHFNVCTQIRSCFREAGIEFYYGQAQKWLNMTIKYLYVIGDKQFDGAFPYLHIPIDNYVFDAAQKAFGVSKPMVAWSRWDDYHNQYMMYQEALRSHITDMDPLRWEFRYWIQEAKSKR